MDAFNGNYISRGDLNRIFRYKYGEFSSVGWSPKQRYEAGYYLPADFYESLVDKLLDKNANWLDVGGGSSLFPQNQPLGQTLTSRAASIVCVDPSDNIRCNSQASYKFQCEIQDFQYEQVFDLATLRMVAEHISNPLAVVRKLNELLKTGGKVVVFTVNLWSPLTILSRVLPFMFHFPIKKLFFGGQKEDTFPTAYKMNTKANLHELFRKGGFSEEFFMYVDDLSTFGKFRFLSRLELLIWRVFRQFRLRYPENCLLAVYVKCGDAGLS